MPESKNTFEPIARAEVIKCTVAEHKSSHFYMKHSTGTFVILVIVILVLALPAAAVVALKGKVTKVIDGDSLIIRSGEVAYEVRLWGVDAPEYNQPHGHAARSYCSELLHGKNVSVQVKGKDRYGRLVGVVFVNSANINEQLVRSGNAWVYRRYCRSSVCEEWKDLEDNARHGRRGGWRYADPLPPWKWRHASSPY